MIAIISIRPPSQFLLLFLSLTALFLFTLPVYAAQDKQNLTVGILTQNPPASLKESSWRLSFERLNRHPEYHFTPLFLTIEQLKRQLDNDVLDFVVSDAINYLILEKDYGILRLLTRNETYSGDAFSSEALSVYTRSDNSDITRLLDLKDKNIAVLVTGTSVSWLFLEKFLFNHGLIIDTNIHIEQIYKLPLLMLYLQNGKVDAIISKSGLIEKHLEQQQLAELRLINPRQGWQAPFLHSSVLIPEWAFAKAWFIDDKLANQIVSLLIDQNNKDVSESSDYFLPQCRWGIAQNYNVLHELFFFSNGVVLQDNPGKSNFSARLQYWISFVIICFLLIVLIMYLRSSRDLNHRLKASKESLEQEINERHHAQELALTHQAELAHVARLSTMGEMASGLAHELNQPLSAIHTYVQGCIRRIQMGNNEPEEIVNALQLTAQQADRAAGIIRRLRSFVRKGETHKTYTEINHIVDEVTSFLESQLKNKNVRLILELEDDLPPVLADIIQIEQVLINLLKNGIEAMSGIEEPTIKVSTRRFTNDLIKLCVIDSGHGISEDKLKRIFNPFFTTKTSGMGMGLSISSSIIEAHDGKLYAENNTKQGARFCFTLPITEQLLGNNNE
ncbi:MAG: ATP-binding protein [Gammaproteobacteria bacterium]|nr:ATP-binding protein [Gammaproteobacteria bacterium]